MSIIKNETIEAILTRQTIREYKPEQITQDELETIIAVAIKAPSGRNGQPCHVRFVQNKEMLHRMHIDYKNHVGWDTPVHTRWETNPFYHNAPTFAFIFAETNSAMEGGLMAENICIAAKSLGLGTCIIASIGALFTSDKGDAWRKELDIPEGWPFVIGVGIGYPDEAPEFKPRDESKFTVIK